MTRRWRRRQQRDEKEWYNSDISDGTFDRKQNADTNGPWLWKLTNHKTVNELKTMAKTRTKTRERVTTRMTTRLTTRLDTLRGEVRRVMSLPLHQLTIIQVNGSFYPVSHTCIRYLFISFYVYPYPYWYLYPFLSLSPTPHWSYRETNARTLGTISNTYFLTNAYF